jgi:hypothetical protein
MIDSTDNGWIPFSTFGNWGSGPRKYGVIPSDRYGSGDCPHLACMDACAVRSTEVGPNARNCKAIED